MQKEPPVQSPQSPGLCNTSLESAKLIKSMDNKSMKKMIFICESHISVDGLNVGRGKTLIGLDVTLIPESQAPGLISHEEWPCATSDL